MQPSEILETARDLVGGDRDRQHGSYQDSMDVIAAMWTAYTGHHFEARDVAWMMVLLKVARERTGSANPDNAIDAAGYAAIAGAVE